MGAAGEDTKPVDTGAPGLAPRSDASRLAGLVRVTRNRVEDDVRSRYLGSGLGIWWAVINPVVLMLTYLVIFGLVFKMRPPAHLPAIEPPMAAYLIFLMSGLIPWMAFNDGVLCGMEAICQNGHIVKSIPFPLTVLPVSAVIANFVGFLVGAVMLGGALIALGLPLRGSLLLLPVAMAIQAVFTIGLAWLLSALLVFVRDARYIVHSLLTAGFFLSPVLWHPDQPELAPYRELIAWNPLVPLITMYRNLLYEGRFLELGELAYLIGWSCALAWLGHRFFERTKPHFESLL
jgi:lipopolysaccharide transport system permease protein